MVHWPLYFRCELLTGSVTSWEVRCFFFWMTSGSREVYIKFIVDNKYSSRIIALDISMAFDNVWHKGVLLKFPSYRIIGRVFSMIMSILTVVVPAVSC